MHRWKGIAQVAIVLLGIPGLAASSAAKPDDADAAIVVIPVSVPDEDRSSYLIVDLGRDLYWRPQLDLKQPTVPADGPRGWLFTNEYFSDVAWCLFEDRGETSFREYVAQAVPKIDALQSWLGTEAVGGMELSRPRSITISRKRCPLVTGEQPLAHDQQGRVSTLMRVALMDVEGRVLWLVVCDPARDRGRRLRGYLEALRFKTRIPKVTGGLRRMRTLQRFRNAEGGVAVYSLHLEIPYHALPIPHGSEDIPRYWWTGFSFSVPGEYVLRVRHATRTWEVDLDQYEQGYAEAVRGMGLRVAETEVTSVDGQVAALVHVRGEGTEDSEGEDVTCWDVLWNYPHGSEEGSESIPFHLHLRTQEASPSLMDADLETLHGVRESIRRSWRVR